ncbi:PAS domain S-box protein, partial [Calditrichota bacterium]
MSTKSKEQLLHEIAELSKEIKLLKKSQKELQNLQTELIESEQRFRALAEAAFETVVVSENGICLDANKAATDMFGYSYDELIGMKGTKVIAPESKKMVQEKTIVGYEEPYEAMAQRKDGTKFWAEFHGKMFDYKGKRTRVTAIRDISARKKAEEDLKEKEKFYHTLFDLSPSGILIIDKNGIILNVNPAFYKSMLYKRSELITKNVEILAHTENKKKVKENIKRLLSGEKIQQVVKSYRKDGTECYMQLNERSITLPNGEKGILSIAQDRTEKVQAELELKKSEEKFRKLIAQSPLAIEILDNKGYLIEANNAWEKLWRVKSEEVVNKYNVFKNPVLKKMGIMPVVKRAFSGEEINLPDIEYDPHGSGFPGRKRWVYSKIYSLKDSFGTIKNIIAIHEDITERKQAELELKESEEKFRILAEKSPNMIFINLMGRITYVNKKCEEILGYTKKEFYNPDFNFMSLISIESIQIIKENFKKHSQGKDVNPYEYTLLTKQGDILNAIIATKLINYDGQKAILGIITDVTERKKAIDALRESEKRFREVSNLTSDYSYCFKVENLNNIKLEWVTGALVKITGYTKEELHEKGGWEKLIFPSDMPIPLDQLKSLLSGKSSVVEYRIVKKDGSIGWIRDYARSELDKNGKKVEHIYGAVQDITDRKSAEIEINRLATLVEQSVESIIITDLQGTIKYVNSAFEKITGYKSEETIGKNPRILKSGKQNKQFYKEMWTKISGGSRWEGIIINKRKNGKLYYEKAVIFPIKDNSGNIINYAGIMRDITMERKLENQLQQIQKMEAIGTLSGGVAHDFNNLLTVINGHAELALMKISKDQKAYNDLLSIFNAGKKAEKLTSQLLAFSRKQIHELKVVDINHLISDLDKMLRRLIPEDIIMGIDLSSNLPYIKADPSQIEQVIINLVINARDAINENKDPQKKKLISIKTQLTDLDDLFVTKHPGSHTGPHILITMNDSGIGMDEETISRIFEPFFTTKEVDKG